MIAATWALLATLAPASAAVTGTLGGEPFVAERARIVPSSVPGQLAALLVDGDHDLCKQRSRKARSSLLLIFPAVPGATAAAASPIVPGRRYEQLEVDATLVSLPTEADPGKAVIRAATGPDTALTGEVAIEVCAP